MARDKTPGDGKRVGAVKPRSQVKNPITGTWTKREDESAKFVDIKVNAKPFRGVREARETRAYVRGRAAARRGQPEHANPYHCATEAQAKHFHDWIRGHRDERKISADIIEATVKRFEPLMKRLADR